MIIEVKDLVKDYDGQLALSGVSFGVEKPQVVGLLGPNGAGKSTLMKILCCYMRPTSGSVQVEGFSSVTDTLAIRSRIGYLPEHNPLYLDMYVREYLDFVGEIYMPRKLVADRREAVLEQVGFGDHAFKKIGSLSKGYRQRLGIAQALIHDPSVLVLDEPTSGLDPNQLEDIRSLIREVGRQKTVILSTHILQEAEAVCERVLLLDSGRLVLDSPMSELSVRVGTRTVYVEFQEPVDISLLKQIPGVTDVFQRTSVGYDLVCAPDSDVRADVFHFAVSRSCIILEMRLGSDSLEYVFHRLTRNLSSEDRFLSSVG